MAQGLSRILFSLLHGSETPTCCPTRPAVEERPQLPLSRPRALTWSGCRGQGRRRCRRGRSGRSQSTHLCCMWDTLGVRLHMSASNCEDEKTRGLNFEVHHFLPPVTLSAYIPTRLGPHYMSVDHRSSFMLFPNQLVAARARHRAPKRTHPVDNMFASLQMPAKTFQHVRNASTALQALPRSARASNTPKSL